MKKELREIINLLPVVYEKPINMFLTGYSYQEISNRMNIPIGTVKSRIHLGKKKIKQVYSA
jgi:RNA polymerase sigma-70 factor (ECF subfamily)